MNLQVRTVKLDGDPSDRSSRDAAFAFRLVSPGGSLMLQAESAALERDAWVAAMQGVITELITAGVGAGPGKGGGAAGSVHAAGLSVAAAVAAGPGNGACAAVGTGAVPALRAGAPQLGHALHQSALHRAGCRQLGASYGCAVHRRGQHRRPRRLGGRTRRSARPTGGAAADAEARAAAIQDRYAKRAFVTQAALAAAASDASRRW